MLRWRALLIFSLVLGLGSLPALACAVHCGAPAATTTPTAGHACHEPAPAPAPVNGRQFRAEPLVCPLLLSLQNPEPRELAAPSLRARPLPTLFSASLGRVPSAGPARLARKFYAGAAPPGPSPLVARHRILRL